MATTCDMPCQPSTEKVVRGFAHSSPDGHMLLAGRDDPLQPQGAATTPGILQAAACAQPALVLWVEGLDLLCTQVIPGPGLFHLQDRVNWAGWGAGRRDPPAQPTPAQLEPNDHPTPTFPSRNLLVPMPRLKEVARGSVQTL